MKIALKTLLTVTIAFLPMWVQAGGIDQLHSFLKNTKTMRADFDQSVVSRSGRKPLESSGVVAISRPGKLRWDIRKPFPQLVVGDGEKIWIYDPELKQITVRKAGQAISGSPAALLSGNNDLEKNFSLADLGEIDGVTWVEAIPKATESGFEKVRLGFAGSDLRAMELHDSFGQTTYIRFSQMERNPALPSATFRFEPPPGVDVVGE